MPETQYRRLTWPHRRKSGLVAVTNIRSSLWLGNDHLLAIDSNGYSESYKRFYFQDIQAITTRLTQRWIIWNWVLGPLLVFCLAGWSYDLLLVHNMDLAGIIVGVACTLLFGVPLLINNLLGPTCACTLRTAVQTDQLPSLCRLRKTRRILDLLRPLVAQAQGQLAPDEIPARLQSWTEAPVATLPSEPAPAPESYGISLPQGGEATTGDNAPVEAPPIISRLKGGNNTAQGNALGESSPNTPEP
jgi:hypothetical protein